MKRGALHLEIFPPGCFEFPPSSNRDAELPHIYFAMSLRFKSCETRRRRCWLDLVRGVQTHVSVSLIPPIILAWLVWYTAQRWITLSQVRTPPTVHLHEGRPGLKSVANNSYRHAQHHKTMTPDLSTDAESGRDAARSSLRSASPSPLIMDGRPSVSCASWTFKQGLLLHRNSFAPNLQHIEHVDMQRLRQNSSIV